MLTIDRSVDAQNPRNLAQIMELIKMVGYAIFVFFLNIGDEYNYFWI